MVLTFIVNFEHNSHLTLMFLSLPLKANTVLLRDDMLPLYNARKGEVLKTLRFQINHLCGLEIARDRNLRKNLH